MTTAVMVVVEKPSEMAGQTGLVENDHVVQALAADRADHALDVGTLPGRARGGEHLFDSHGLDLLHKLRAEDPIPIPQQVTRSAVPGKRFPQLVRRPFGRRVGRDAKMQNAPTVVSEHQKHGENLKADRRYREEM